MLILLWNQISQMLTIVSNVNNHLSESVLNRRKNSLAYECDDGTSKWPQAASATICDKSRGEYWRNIHLWIKV